MTARSPHEAALIALPIALLIAYPQDSFLLLIVLFLLLFLVFQLLLDYLLSTTTKT